MLMFTSTGAGSTGAAAAACEEQKIHEAKHIHTLKSFSMLK